MNTSVYEAWVVGLRAWQDDPTTDLSGLPPLTIETFTPATYERLLGHLRTAVDDMMQNWNRGLIQALSTAVTDHDRERALVQSRLVLARRVQLSQHPSLPEEVTEAFYQSTCRDIRSLQADLERAMLQSTARGSSDREAQERALRIVKAAPLTALIEPGFDVEAFLAGLAPASTPAPRIRDAGISDLPLPPLDPAPRRRVVID